MSFPLVPVASHPELAVLAALAIGFAFGFVLERAGFGRAPKLAAQFYLRDMTVFKVMFGAIVTAMLGLVALGELGVVDARAITATAASDTYLGPMVAGGFLLGIGFIISGYCPGTSVVAMASGKADGLATVGGVIAGSALYAELQRIPTVQQFHNSGARGLSLIPDALGVAPAWIALAVALVAVGCFVGAEWVERSVASRQHAEPPPSPPATRRTLLAVYATAAVAVALLLALPHRAEAARGPEAIAAPELARRAFTEPWRMRVVDLRSPEAFAAKRVPGSEAVPAAGLEALDLATDRSGRDLVLVADGLLAELPRGAREYPGHVLALTGGFTAWGEYVLAEPPALPATASEAEREAWRTRVAIHAFATGAKAAPPPPPAAAPAPKRKSGGGGGCGG